MKNEIKKKVLKPLGLYALAFSLVLPSLSGVVEAAAEIKESKADKILASQEKKIEENKKEAQEPKKEAKEEKKDESKEKPQLETKKAEKEIRPDEREKAIVENTDESDNDGLEISDENVGEAVRGEKEIDPKLSKPTINPVAIGSNVVTGDGLVGANRRKRASGPCKIHVTVTDVEGNEVETKTFSIEKGTNPKKGEPQWSVTLDNAVQKGYKIVAQQELDGKFSNESDPYVVKELLAEQHKNDLKMPEGEIWIEQTSSNQVNADEQAEAVQMLKDANTAIAGDIESVKFSIDGTSHAYYEVTYTDKSTSGKIEAPDLKIKQVTEYSRGATLGSITIVDNVIKGKLSGEGPFDGIKVQIVLKLSDAVKDSYCDKGECLTDKDTGDPVSATVNGETGEFSYIIPNPDLKLDQEVGVIVKEPHKFKSCSKTTVKPVVVGKTEVKDPRKLTKDDKTAIDAAIRTAYTLNGESKLPNGTGDWDGVPAVIQIDDSGNVKIFSGNNVKGDWDWNNGGIFVPEKNADGSFKLKDGAQPERTIPAKDLLKNIKPDAPAVAHDAVNNKITITTNPLDTDAKEITIKYTPDGATEKTTVTATKGEDGNWTAPDGFTVTIVTVGEDEDKKAVVVSFKDDKIKNKTNVTASITDAGGIDENDEEEKAPKTSEDGSKEIKILPKKPEITVDKNTGDVTITPVEKDKDRIAKKMDITYTPAGKDETKTVTATRDDEGKWTVLEDSDFKVSEDGKSITIANDKIKSNTDIKAKTNDGDTTDLLTSDEASGTIPDKIAPKPPTVTVNTSDGNAQITPPTDPDTKTVIVKYPDPSGTEKTAIATKGNDGWTITEGAADGVKVDSTSGLIKIPYEKMKKADTVSATAKDDSDNESKSSTDTTLPPVPQVEVTEKKDITVTPPTTKAPAVDGMEISYTPANSTETNTIKVKKGNDSKWTIEGDTPEGVSINQDSGVVTFAKGTAKDDTKVSALSKIGEDKKGLETAEKQVPDTTAPEAPEVKVQEDGSVTITPKKDSDTKTVTVTYKDENGENKTATATKGDDNKWTVEGTNGETIDPDSGVITIPTGKSNPGDKVEAKAKDAADNESGPSDDTTKPAPPTVTPDQESGNVTITPPTKGNLDGMDIGYKTPDGTDRKVRVAKDSDNKWKIEGENPDGVTVDEGTGLVTIPKGKAKEKTEVTADSTLGDKKAPAEKTPENQHLVPDKTAPNPPKVDVDTKTGNITITPPSDEDTTSVTVTYKDKNDTEKTPKAKKDENGKWTIENNENGETVDAKSGVITIPKGNYKTEQAVIAYGNDNVDNKSTDDAKTPVEVTFEANGGSKTMDSSILALGKENDQQGQSTVLPADFKLPECSFAAPAGKEFAGWQVNGETKKAGEIIQINANTTVKALWKDKAADKPGDGGSPGQDKPNKPEEQIPGIKIRDHYTPTFPVYVTVPKTEKVEKLEEVPVSLETHKAYIAGYEDNTLRAEGNITRAEAAAMVTRLAGLDLSDNSMPAFKDMQKNAWYFRYINAAVKANMLDADNGMMRPNDKITRAEFAKMLAAIDKENSSVSKFEDIKGHRYEKEINKIYGNNRIEGYEDGSFRPDANLTRAESAAFLNRMFNRIADKEAYAGLEEKLARFKDFDTSKWYYDEMVEATNSHELTRRGKASDKFGRVYEKWTRILPSDVK